MRLAFSISTGSATPIYRQITDQIRLAIATGKLTVDDQLPSVRALAEELVINPNTVAKAYADLARNGVIEARAGRGMFVNRKRKVFTREEGWRRLEPLIESLLGEALAMDFSPDEVEQAVRKKLIQWKPERKGQHEQ
jgi:GntR family transcriptional regulator